MSKRLFGKFTALAVMVCMFAAFVPHTVLAAQDGIHENFDNVSDLADLTWLKTGFRNAGTPGGSVTLADTPNGKGGKSIYMQDTDNTSGWYSPNLTVELPKPVTGKSYMEMTFRNSGNLYLELSGKKADGSTVKVTKLSFDINGSGVKEAIRIYETDTGTNVRNKVPGGSYVYGDDEWYTVRMELDSAKSTYDVTVASEQFKTYEGGLEGANAEFDKEAGIYTCELSSQVQKSRK